MRGKALFQMGTIDWVIEGSVPLQEMDQEMLRTQLLLCLLVEWIFQQKMNLDKPS